MSENRTGWLSKLLGTDKAEAVRADLNAAAATLDNAGVERKELSEKSAPPTDEAVATEPAPSPVPDESSVAQQVAEKLGADITTAVGGDFSQLTQEKLVSLLTTAMEPPEDAEQEAVTPPEGMQMAQDNNKSVVQPAAAVVGTSESVKALLDTLAQQTEDQGELVKAFKNQAAEIEAIKALGPKIAELIEWKAQIEQQLTQRPRASEDAGTTLPEGDEAKALAEAIQKGLQGPDQTFLGVRVKNVPK